MPHANKETTPIAIDEDVIEGRYAEVGDFTIGFETFHQDVDPAPLFGGLPDDRCQCPHWGIVQSGSLTMRYADRVETYGAGDAYYAEPGHLPLLTAGTRLTEFSPTSALRETMAVIEQNMAVTS